MLNAIAWFVLLILIGWAAFPLAYRFLSFLPDRGYSVSKALGLLLWGFAYWLLGSYGLLDNSAESMLFVFVLLVGLSAWVWKRLPHGELKRWLKENRRLIISIEALFLLAFAFMVYVRAVHPEVLSTEKDMELAFISANLRAPSMPPHDPWLSGYAISYYYFGYLMVSMLATLSGTMNVIAFNLGLAMVFAMAALGAYGLAYNLLALRYPQAERRDLNLGWALLAPFFVLLLGNVEGLLEILHARHLFWNLTAPGEGTSAFWSWLNIKDLNLPPVGDPDWTPRLFRTGSWWWWRASRVINDLNFAGNPQELIDEIPAFSFTLGDLHPHVLSMPFIFLAIAVGFNLFLGGGEPEKPLPIFALRIRWSYLALSIVVLGGLAFLNIWDFPLYLGLFAGLYTYRRILADGWAPGRVEDFITAAITIGLGGYLAYLPYYLGFTSQAGGILPNLLNPSRGAHLWVLFGLFFIALFAYLIFLWRRDWQPRRFWLGLLAGLGIVFGLWLLSLLYSWLLLQFLTGSEIAGAIRGLGVPDVPSLFSESLSRRLLAFGGWLTLAALLGLILGLLWPWGSEAAENEKELRTQVADGRIFVLLLMLFAALVVIVPEFIYLRDQFGTRMNTVFKFFFQAWQIWGVVAAYGLAVLIKESTGVGRALSGLALVLVLGIGAIYPSFAFADIAYRREGQPLQLVGDQAMSAEEWAAVRWLQQAPLGTLVEAVGGSYTDYARFSAHSGQKAVIGWPGHEGQWRGQSVDFFPRVGDVELLYSTSNWVVAQEILERYQVDYVVVSNLERITYNVDQAKFDEHLDLVFANSGLSIYQVP